MIKTAFHPNGTMIKFSSENHLYVDEHRNTYTSVTTFIGSFFKSFDKITIAEKCANSSNPKYQGRNPDDIISEWEKEGDRGRDEGTNIHEYAENKLNGIKPPEPLSDRCRLIFKQVDKAISELERFYNLIGTEVLIFDPVTRIAGTIDLLMHHKGQNEVLIFDWKQNKKINNSNVYQSGLHPINHLQDTDLNHYCLQLSLYEWLLKRGNYFPGNLKFNRALIHLSEDDFEFIRLEDFRYEIVEMIKTKLDATGGV